MSSGTRLGAATNHTDTTRPASTTTRLSRWRRGSMSGALFIRAESLAQATTDPVKVTAPMKTPAAISTR